MIFQAIVIPFSKKISRTLFLCSVVLFSAQSAAIDVPVAFIGAEDSAAFKGTKQGLDEANLQGEFLGQTYVLTAYPLEDVSAAGEAVFIITAVDEQGVNEVSETFSTTPILNITDKSNSLRDKCSPHTFHVIPSQRMDGDAVAQYHQKKEDAVVTAAAWNDKFRKYAALQVSNRFLQSTGEPMTDEAWAGWMAMKIVADAIARTASTDGEALTRFLHDDLVIDGAKGLKQTFRPNGQLRQMVMIVENGKVVGEAPVRGVSSDLDSLGSVECVPE